MWREVNTSSAALPEGPGSETSVQTSDWMRKDRPSRLVKTSLYWLYDKHDH